MNLMSPSPQQRKPSSETSSLAASADRSADAGTTAVHAPETDGFDLYSFRESEEGKELTAWALNEVSRSRGYKTRKRRQRYTFMAFTFGHQWIDIVGKNVPGSGASPIKAKPAPSYMGRRTVNRIRSFVRTEQSKFLSTLPTVTSVPATSEEEDVRAAYAGEQVIESYFS